MRVLSTFCVLHLSRFASQCSNRGLFECGEDRLMQLVWPRAGRIHDVDDTCELEYGVYDTQRIPLTAESRA